MAQNAYLVAMHEQFGHWMKEAGERDWNRALAEEEAEDLRR